MDIRWQKQSIMDRNMFRFFRNTQYMFLISIIYYLLSIVVFILALDWAANQSFFKRKKCQ